MYEPFFKTQISSYQRASLLFTHCVCTEEILWVKVMTYLVQSESPSFERSYIIVKLSVLSVLYVVIEPMHTTLCKGFILLIISLYQRVVHTCVCVCVCVCVQRMFSVRCVDWIDTTKCNHSASPLKDQCKNRGTVYIIWFLKFISIWNTK